jgi:hypothetical protein
VGKGALAPCPPLARNDRHAGAVVASAREPIHLATPGKNGLRRRFAPRNDARFTHAFAFSRRDAPELCRKSFALQRRGRGECRVPNAPAAWCALLVVSMHTSIHSGGTGIIRHSPRNGFTAYSALSPVTSSFLPPSPHGLHGASTRLGRSRLRRLSISNGCQDHTTSPYASMPFVWRVLDAHRSCRSAPHHVHARDIVASTASRPTFRDDRP